MRLQTAVLLSQLIDEQERREERLKNTIVSELFLLNVYYVVIMNLAIARH